MKRIMSKGTLLHRERKDTEQVVWKHGDLERERANRLLGQDV